MEGGVNSKWFKTSWTVLLLFSLVVSYINRMDEPLWGSAERWHLLNNILTYLALVGILALFIRSNICNWRIGPRLFWRKWTRWGKSMFGGAIFIAIFLLFLTWVKPHSVLNREAILICSAIVGAVGLTIKLVASYMYKHSAEDKIQK